MSASSVNLPGVEKRKISQWWDCWLVSKMCQGEESYYSFPCSQICFWQPHGVQIASVCVEIPCLSSLIMFSGSLFAETRCPFSLFCLCSTHPVSYLELLEAKFLFSDEHLPMLTHESCWQYRRSLPSRSWGKEKAWKAYVAVWWQSTERDTRLLRPHMQMELDFSPMLGESFSRENRVSATHLLPRAIS